MIKVYKLSNGIPVITEKTNTIQSCNIQISFSTGSVFETTQNNGVSHIAEHMLFKGTKKRTYKQITEDVDKIGGQINAFTSQDLTAYYIKVLSEKTVDAIEILSDMILNSQIPEDELEKEKKVILEEKKTSDDDPGWVCLDNLFSTIYKKTMYEKTVIGTKKTIKNMTRDEIKKYIKKNYAANRMVVAIFGNYDLKSVLNALEKYFSHKKPVKAYWPKYSENYKPAFKYKKKDIKQTHFAMGMRMPKFKRKQKVALTVFNEIFGGGMSSRLFQNLREKLGLCYSIYSSVSMNRNCTDFHIYCGVANEKVEATYKAIVRELKDMAKTMIEEDELERIKTTLISGTAFSNENIVNRMQVATRQYVRTKKIKSSKEAINLLKTITPEDVLSIAQHFQDIERYTISIVSSETFDKKAFSF